MPGILHLITGLETGGAERMLARLVARIDRDRFPSFVVSMTGVGVIGAAISDAGVRLHTLDMRRGWPDPRAILRLRRIMRELRPAILQTWLYHADLLGLSARQLGFAPRLVWNLRCTESSGSPMVRRILSRASRVPDAVIVNSHAGQRFHESVGYRPQHWVHIPNGFDAAGLHLDPEARPRRRSELGIAEDADAILLPARYDPMKDHATFLAAAARLATVRPEAIFALAGGGIDTRNRTLMAAIAEHELGDRVVLLGERADLDMLYPAFDLVTLSSAYGEGFPNVLGEAMACGIPCVATDIGDSAAIIGDTGMTVPPRDPKALAAAWQRLLALGREERTALGARARDRILREYDLDGIVRRYEALYEKIAAS